MKFKQIAIVDKVNLTDEAKMELQSFSENPLKFPETDSKDEKETIIRIGNADAVLGSFKSKISKNVLEKCPNIKYIGICGTNLFGIDLVETQKRGITVTNVSDYGDEATAELVFTYLLNLARGIGKYQWKPEPAELNGKTIGVVGLGAVGKQVALRALGFNMKVVYFSKSRNQEWEKKGLEFLPLDELLQKSDVISLHVPPNTVVLKETEFSKIPSGTILVDVCLGTIFDVDAFIAWIKKENNFVILDMKTHLAEKLNGLKNIIGLDNQIPGAMTGEAKNRLSEKFIKNIQSYFDQ